MSIITDVNFMGGVMWNKVCGYIRVEYPQVTAPAYLPKQVLISGTSSSLNIDDPWTTQV